MVTKTSPPTINQELIKAHREQFKIDLLIGDSLYCYESCVIQHIGRITITFVCTSYKGENDVLMSYTINKKLITGIGIVIASLPMIDDFGDDEIWNMM